MKIQFYKLIDKYVGVPLCIAIGVLNKAFPVKNTTLKKILLIKLWAVGDSVVTLPLVKALKEHNPNAQIDVLARERNKAVFTDCKYIDNVVPLEPYNWKKLVALWKKYDLTIDAEPYMRLSALLSWAYGKRNMGFANQARSLIYNQKTKFRHDQHMVENYLDFAKLLGIDTKQKQLVKLEVPQREKNMVDRWLREKEIKKEDFIVGICPGAAESASKTRVWVKERYAQLADILAEKWNAKVVFLGSPAERQEIDEMMNMMKHPAVNEAGELTIKQAFYLIEKLSCMISNDTGPMHIAAAQGVPTVGLFGPNTPVLWKPFGEKNIAIYHKLSCSPCIKNDKGYTPDCLRKKDKYKCMRLITVEEVTEAVERCTKLLTEQ